MESGEQFLGEKLLTKGKENLPSNIVLINTPAANFRIAYGNHDKERKPEELDKADAWLPETGGGIDYTATKESVEDTFNEKINTKEYKEIFEKSKEKEIPIFLTDVAVQDATTILQLGLRSFEGVAGIVLLNSLAKDFKKGTMTRRDFIKKTVAGIYLISDLPTAVMGYFLPEETLDNKSATRAIEKFTTDLNEEIHPEKYSIILSLRNQLFAQKMKTIAEKLDVKERKPEVAITVGALHHGIEKALMSEDKERIEAIDKLLSVPGLKDTRERIASIARFDFNKEKNKWEMTDRFKDPHLAKIEK